MNQYLKAILNILLFLIELVILFWILPKIALFFAPFLVAWVIALLASPVVNFLEDKLKIKRKAGSAVVIIIVIGLVVLLLYLACMKIGRETVGLVQELPEMLKSAEQELSRIGERFQVYYSKLPIEFRINIGGLVNSLGEMLGNIAGGIGSPTIVAVGSFAKRLPSVLIGIIMSLLASYCFVADRKMISSGFRRYLSEELVNHWQVIKKSLGKAVGGYFKAQFKIELWIYILLVVGFSIMHIKYAFLIAIGLAILDFLPFFGTGTVMLPWAIIKLLGGQYSTALGLLIIWGVGQLVRQIIQPKYVGESVGMPPIPTLFLLYIGYKLGGVIGMIIAVPFGLIAVTLYKEGVFDTTRHSMEILARGIRKLRQYTPEELEEKEQ